MSICAKLSELPKCKIRVADFGGGPSLVTESHGATAVLSIQLHGRGGVAPHLVACNERGILDADSALVVLERICRLWNAAIHVEYDEDGVPFDSLPKITQ